MQKQVIFCPTPSQTMKRFGRQLNFWAFLRFPKTPKKAVHVMEKNANNAAKKSAKKAVHEMKKVATNVVKKSAKKAPASGVTLSLKILLIPPSPKNYARNLFRITRTQFSAKKLA